MENLYPVFIASTLVIVLVRCGGNATTENLHGRYDAAIATANGGQSDAATEVAQQIAETAQRIAILEKIATAK